MLSLVPYRSSFISGFMYRLPVHQLEIFVTESEYKLCNMATVINMANKNDPNGSASGQIHPNTSSTEGGAKEKLFLKEKKYRIHVLFGTRV